MMQVVANGKTFTFPDGTSTDQIGSAIDEYFAGQSQPQQQQAPEGVASGIGQGLAESGRAVLKAGVDTANILPAMADSLSSAAAWAGDKIGIGDGTYDPSPRLSLPESMQPQTSGGKLMGEALPYLVNLPAKAPVAAAKIGEKAANLIGRLAGETVVGSAASASDAKSGEFAGQFGKNLAENMVIGAGFTGLTKVAGRAYGGIKNAATKADDAAATALARADDAEAQRILGQLSPEQQAIMQQRILERQGDAQGTLRELAKQSRSSVRSDLNQLAGNVQPNERAIQAAENIGFPIEAAPAAWTSKNRQYVEFERALKSLPASKLAEQDRVALEALNTTADKLITDLKGTPDLSVVSQKVLDQMSKTRTQMATKTNAMYDELKAKIAPTTPADAKPVIDYVKNRVVELGGKSALLSPGEKKILSTLQGKPTYAALDQVRRDIVQARISATGPFKDSDSYLLGQLEERLLESQRGTIQKSNPGMLDLFDAARASVGPRKELEDNIIKLYGKNKTGDIVDNMRQSVNMLANGSTTKFNALMNSVPPDMRNYVAASAISKALTGKATTPGVTIAPTQYVNWYQGVMRNAESRRALAKNLPQGGMKALRNMYVFNKGVSNALKADITTGRISAIKDAFNEASTLGDAIVNKTAKNVLGRVPFVGEPIANVVAAANAPGRRMEIATDLIASQEFRDLARQQAVWNNASARQVKAAEAALKKSAKYKRWLSGLDTAERMGISEGGLVKYLRATAQAESQE